MRASLPTYYEFFAGGGLVRAGLGPGWRCLLANDRDPKKAAAYCANWGESDLILGDVAELQPQDLPGRADLAWASFPCQDLSLAGGGAGLAGARSGTFWHFWRLVLGLQAAGRAPRIVALENVYGALTSHGGADFQAICQALTQAGYQVGALVINAQYFVPQSRPRLFLIGVQGPIPAACVSSSPVEAWCGPRMQQTVAQFEPRLRKNWVWWNLPVPNTPAPPLPDLLESHPPATLWRNQAATRQLLQRMTPPNQQKLAAAQQEAQRIGRAVHGLAYVRTRQGAPRTEVRFDQVAGCLRTPGGGSSRQIVLEVTATQTRARLLSPRETARLMGLPDSYHLPAHYNTAYHLTGDGVAAPVVRWLAAQLFEPLLAAQPQAAAGVSDVG